MWMLRIGVGLLALSAPSLILWGREMWIGSAVSARYSVMPIVGADKESAGGALRGEIDGHTVELLDDQPVKSHEPFKVDDARAEGVVRIVVDGQVRSKPVAATIRLHSRDANRHFGYVNLQRLLDREGPERLIVAENLGLDGYRVVSVFPDGRVVEDQFRYDERCSPPVRALSIRAVVPHPSGYCSDAMQVWPTIFYPILYPIVSAGVGLLLLAGEGARWARGRVSGHPVRPPE